MWISRPEGTPDLEEDPFDVKPSCGFQKTSFIFIHFVLIFFSQFVAGEHTMIGGSQFLGSSILFLSKSVELTYFSMSRFNLLDSERPKNVHLDSIFDLSYTLR